MTVSAVYSGFSYDTTTCIMPAACTAGSVEATVDGVTYTTALTCDGTAEAASTGCMVCILGITCLALADHTYFSRESFALKVGVTCTASTCKGAGLSATTDAVSTEWH
jgi:hypothetical protein